MAAYEGYHLLVPEGITDEETAKVAELKGLIEAKFELSEEENIVNHPPWLLRFLRARDGDVGKAAGKVATPLTFAFPYPPHFLRLAPRPQHPQHPTPMPTAIPFGRVRIDRCRFLG